MINEIIFCGLGLHLVLPNMKTPRRHQNLLGQRSSEKNILKFQEK